MACGILVPQPGIEPMSAEVEVQSLNHWAANITSKAFCRSDSPIHLVRKLVCPLEEWKGKLSTWIYLLPEDYDKSNFSSESAFKFLEINCWANKSRGVKITLSISLEARFFFSVWGLLISLLKRNILPTLLRSMLLTSLVIFCN